MILEVYSIRDAKTNQFAFPWAARARGEALRIFEGVVNDERTFINKYPEDYDLYFHGHFDDNDGKFQLEHSPVHIKKAVELKKLAEQTAPDAQ